MPKSPRRMCPRCNALIEPGHQCDQHPQVRIPVIFRDPKRQRLYGRRWQKRRARQLAEHPWCEECLRANIYEPATDVHHTQRHQGDPIIFITSPLESLCHTCHSRKTAEEVNKVGGPKKFSNGERRAGGAFGTKNFPNVRNPD